MRQFSVFSLLSFLCLTAPSLSPAQTAVPQARIDQGTLSIPSHTTDPKFVQVYAEGSNQPLFGSFTSEHGILHFKPSIPFALGATYRVEIRHPGHFSDLHVTLEKNKPQRPQVRLSPATREVPANTLKLYLDFTQPMEQGVFLNYITLRQQNGQEVAGAFRETELWTPDGQRLTLMLHPGRQKTGVNLNLDEGPVLIAGSSYTLAVDARWRSTSGMPLGQEATFSLQATAADHAQPDPAKWQIRVPAAKTRSPLQITTDELFEPEILCRALQIPKMPGAAHIELLPKNRVLWSWTPEKPWQPGEYAIRIDPALEDLAGNSITKPMEVDLTATAPPGHHQPAHLPHSRGGVAPPRLVLTTVS
ncbi:MAG: hypothetical protein IPK32_25050 [Verrucomicrobiaceae bacterium]|nr:hypothetical protein [Verrucomicrobiaceae bacterium]